MKAELKKLEIKYGKEITPDTKCSGAGDKYHRCLETRCKEAMIPCINGCSKKFCAVMVCDPKKHPGCSGLGYCNGANCRNAWLGARHLRDKEIARQKRQQLEDMERA